MAYSALYHGLSALGDTIFCKEIMRHVGEMSRYVP
jgi:hypothetical protein